VLERFVPDSDSRGGAGFYQGLHGGNEVLGKEGLHAEVDTQGGVLVLCFGEAADDEHRNFGGELAEAGNELGAVHAGHDVVGDDELDGFGVVVIAELLEGAFRAQDGEDEVAGSLEDGLTGRGLDGVVVDEQEGVWHVDLRPCRPGFMERYVFSLCRSFSASFGA